MASERAMETPGDLVSFVHEEYHRYKDGACGFQYEMKYVRTCLPLQKTEEMHTTFAVNAAIAACYHFLTFLFAALIAVDNTSRDSGPPGHGKTMCGNDEDALQCLNKFSWVITGVNT